MNIFQRIINRVMFGGKKYAQRGDVFIQKIEGYPDEAYDTIAKAIETGKPQVWHSDVGKIDTPPKLDITKLK